MKKLLFTILISLLSCYSLSAQDQTGLFSLGANLSYGSENNLMGFGGRMQYGFTEHIRGSAEYKYYMDRRNWSEWQINMDAHYMLQASKSVSVYPITGLRMSRWTYDNKRGGANEDQRYKTSTTRLGLNLGLGGQIWLSNNLYLQIEPKYEISKNYSQFAGLVGLLLQF